MRVAQPIIACALVLLCACGNKGEAKEARRSLYDADFAVVYRATLEAVRELYPERLQEDPAKGRISTAWNPVSFSNTGAEDPASIRTQDRALGMDPQGTSGNRFATRSSLAFKKYYIRFDVTVAGGRPWRIRVVGRAQEYQPGNALPTDLKGPQTPHWLPGRTDALVASIHKKLKKYAIRAPEQAPVSEEPAPIDVTAFGPIPPDAAKRIGEVRRAITQRDYGGLREHVAADVTWDLGAAPGVDGALAMWQADPAILEAMAEAIDAGCRGGGEAQVVCPPAAAETPGFTGWRLTVKKGVAGWVITSFIQGD